MVYSDEMPAVELTPGKTERDLLVEIVVTLNRLVEDTEKNRDQLEPRVRALENFRWWILGAAATMSMLGGIVGHILLHG
jgi:hypothetical protein